MIKTFYLILVLCAMQPVIALAAEDTHGILIDRGIMRSSGGVTPPPVSKDKAVAADKLPVTSDKSKTPDAEGKTDDKKDEIADEKNSNQKAQNDKDKSQPSQHLTQQQSYRKTERDAALKAQNYYQNKHRNTNYIRN